MPASSGWSPSRRETPRPARSCSETTGDAHRTAKGGGLVPYSLRLLGTEGECRGGV